MSSYIFKNKTICDIKTIICDIEILMMKANIDQLYYTMKYLNKLDVGLLKQGQNKLVYFCK